MMEAADPIAALALAPSPPVDSGARCNGFMKTVFGRLCQAL